VIESFSDEKQVVNFQRNKILKQDELAWGEAKSATRLNPAFGGALPISHVSRF
jgi:hypothetical protein